MYSSLPSPIYPNDPVKEVDGYTLLGAKVTQEVVKGVRLHVAVRNLLDADYESEAGFPAGADVRGGGLGDVLRAPLRGRGREETRPG